MASVDPRGTLKRGRVFEHSTYKELGKLETEDFIDFGEYLGANPMSMQNASAFKDGRTGDS